MAKQPNFSPATARIEYVETAAKYEVLNLANGEMAEGLSPDEIRAIARAFDIDQNLFLGAIPVQRVGFVLKVKADRLDEYKKQHEQVWPEMLDALQETGWHNYSLFLREDGLLFGYLETPDFDKALAGMAETDVNARWQAEMAPFFEAVEGRRPDEGMLQLEEVFHLA